MNEEGKIEKSLGEKLHDDILANCKNGFKIDYELSVTWNTIVLSKEMPINDKHSFSILVFHTETNPVMQLVFNRIMPDGAVFGVSYNEHFNITNEKFDKMPDFALCTRIVTDEFILRHYDQIVNDRKKSFILRMFGVLK